VEHRHPVEELDQRYLAGSDIDLAHLEEALRSSREWWQAIFQAAGIGILLGDTDGRILSTNKSLQDMLGYSESELKVLGVEKISHPEDLEADRHLFTELIEGKRAHYQLEKRYLRKDGSMMWGSLTVLLLKDEAGAPRFGIALLQDISRSKRTEESEERLVAALTQQRQALELNDEVVQGLAVAKMALETGDRDLALRTVDSTLAAARTIVGRLLSHSDFGEKLAGGWLVRERAAEVEPRDRSTGE
jgi:PAS domain S-box-containing protein